MAYRWEKNQLTGENEIVIDGFQNGIADSPHLGIADMRNLNNDSIPGIVMCNYALKSISHTPITTAVFTANVGDNTVNLVSGAFTTSIEAVTFAGTDLPDPLVAGTVYWAVKSTATKAVIYSKYDQFNSYNTAVTLTDAGSGGMSVSSVNIGTINYSTKDTLTGIYYLLDSNGRVWAINLGGVPVLISGNTLTNGNGNGIAVYKNYLFVFRNDKIDVYGNLSTAAFTWTNGWQTINTASSTNNSHQSKSGQDDILYYCDGRYLGSVAEKANQTFDPSSGATYTFTSKALTLPINEITSYMEEQSNVYLTIGTSTSNYLYPWDRTSTSYIVPIPMPEIGCYRMININRILYIFAGQRGNIYYTNGSAIFLFKSMPKQPTKTPYPSITWGGVISLNNNLCFGATDVSRNAAGCWAITLAIGELLNAVPGAIRYKGQPSAGVYNTTNLIAFANGIQYYACWFNGTYGGIDILDSTTPTFYTNYEGYLESDIIPVGTALQQRTFNTVELKLDSPLTAGEKIRVSMRSDLVASYTQVLEITATGAIDGSSSSIPVQAQKWIQIKVELQTTGSSNSFVRLKDVRIR